MKIIVTHASPDLDAITSVWLIKRFLPNWENALVQFVPAGEKIGNLSTNSGEWDKVIEPINDNQVIHVDTGMGPLDHHQTADKDTCAASLTWEYVKQHRVEGQKWQEKEEAIDRIVGVVVEDDHFREVFYSDPTADYHEFSLRGILEGIKMQYPNKDDYYIDFIMNNLDAIVHTFENRLWAEKEIAEKGKKFNTRFGEGIGFESINDAVVKLSQKMGYRIVVRKDPRKGYVRIKARPSSDGEKEIDLTLVYEKLSKMDPEATWFLHVSKKMLLNGTAKNPKMKPSKLTLEELIHVLEAI